jgi:hypothetical protein
MVAESGPDSAPRAASQIAAAQPLGVEIAVEQLGSLITRRPDTYAEALAAASPTGAWGSRSTWRLFQRRNASCPGSDGNPD